MVMRISGLASGFDTENTIAKLMQAARIPLDKLRQSKQTLDWRRDEYRTINNKVLEFRNLAFNMKLQSTYQSKKVSAANESVVSVTGTASANEGNYTFAVKSLAQSASLTSAATLGADAGEQTKLDKLGITDGTALTIGGEKGKTTVTLQSGDSIGEMVAKINAKSTLTGVKATYDANLDRLFFVSSSTGEQSNIELKMYGSGTGLKDAFKLDTAGAGSDPTTTLVGNGSKMFTSTTDVINKDLTAAKKLKLNINGTAAEYEITSTTTVGQLLDKINADHGSKGITAHLKDGKISFINEKAGTTTLDIASDNDAGLLTSLGLDSTTSTPVTDYSTIKITGQNAEVFFNGVKASYATNTMTIGGMTFTAKTESAKSATYSEADADKASSYEQTKVTVSQDVDTVFKTIKDFVDKYNELIDTVNNKISEKRYRDFAPLTDEQKAEMKEEDIKKWEEKAKSGMLRSDMILNRGLTNFRSAVSQVMSDLPSGQLKSLAEVGISTSILIGNTVSGSYLEKGKLYIDEDKLKKALAEKPDEVMALFTKDDGNKETSTGDGFATRMYEKASALFTDITNKAGVLNSVEEKYLIGKETKRINERIDRMITKMEDLETRYYKQFTAMETYLNRMNAQSNWLSQQFSSGG
ncbi:flagellar filament capping protein FliD [Paenibacillus puerhi]|uniref:flagellar filament capping protein FliD n=1 Tax=Paenibacillus puerhi TaxID=2692622 RepID=UPI0013577895|nr:flagellar filament capping protein FliD [Paenibacillus puerhi]